MRPSIIVLCLVSGCSQPEPSTTGLYKDDEIRKLAKFEIDKEADRSGGVFHIPCLDVVPHGTSLPRSEVFSRLNIDDSRICHFRQHFEDFVEFLTWQVSPSYDICCMSALNDPDNNGLEMTDPKRKVYGIRLIKRSRSTGLTGAGLHKKDDTAQIIRFQAY
jgi:hypothetical protein